MKKSGSYFFNYFEFLLLSEIEATVCQSQLIFLDSPFKNSIFDKDEGRKQPRPNIIVLFGCTVALEPFDSSQKTLNLSLTLKQLLLVVI